MKHENTFLWILRLSWPLLGGSWGAWVGFGGYGRITPNADSFGSLLTLGFFTFFGAAGCIVGAVSAALIGGLGQWLLRRLSMPIVGAVCVATIVNALLLWQLADLVQARFPGLRAPLTAPGAAPKTPLRPDNPCTLPPPENPKERANWNAECR